MSGQHNNPTTETTATDNNNANNNYNEEKRCAIVLFVIVTMFFVCNVPRIVLNFYEFFTIEDFREDNECYVLPLWVMVMTSVSVVLMTINSSVNFFIYCLVNTKFREELKSRWLGLKRWLATVPLHQEAVRLEHF
jgi:Na+(H+)/acetate symporter ActP